MPPGKCDEGVAEGAGRAENTFVPWRRQRGAAAAGVAPHFLHFFAPKLSTYVAFFSKFSKGGVPETRVSFPHALPVKCDSHTACGGDGMAPGRPFPSSALPP